MLKLFQTDAFTSELFGGNPAAVVPLESWIDDAVLQSIAAENNLAETAFIVPISERLGIALVYACHRSCTMRPRHTGDRTCSCNSAWLYR